MKLKKIQLLSYISNTVAFLAICLAVATAGGSTASAYTCIDPSNPTNNPLTGDVWEYHDDSASGGQGQCWHVRYTEAGPATYNATTQSLSCPSDQVFHADNSTCWKKDGFTIQDTNNIAPVNNDGTPLKANNIACTDGFNYIATGKDPPGCYKADSNGQYRCAVNQDVKISGVKGGGVQSCGDTENRVVPKNPKQSADKTKAGATASLCKDGSTPNQSTGKCADGSKPTKLPQSPSVKIPPSDTEKCGEAETVLISCDQKDCGVGNGVFEGVPVIGCVLKYGIQILTVLVGIAAVGGIALESLQYARAQDDQSVVSNARKRIRDIVIGLLVYGFMIAFINWLIPGSVIQ